MIVCFVVSVHLVTGTNLVIERALEQVLFDPNTIKNSKSAKNSSMERIPPWIDVKTSLI